MLGLGKAKAVAEYKARGEIERIYHEITHILRVTGINLNFRTWAKYDKFFPVMWRAVRLNAATYAFEAAADRLRADAVEAAEAIGRLHAPAAIHLGESQAYQIRAALALYHYINPKLLLLTAAVRLALYNESVGGQNGVDGAVQCVRRGPPLTMYPLEMVAAVPDDIRLRSLFDDIKQTLALSSVNSDYRTLALWPDYLAAVWERLKPMVQRQDYQQAADALRETARTLARTLPYRVPLSRQQVEELGEDVDEVIQTTDQFERLLPGLILNIALCALDWHPAEALQRSPFPAAVCRQPRTGGRL